MTAIESSVGSMPSAFALANVTTEMLAMPLRTGLVAALTAVGGALASAQVATAQGVVPLPKSVNAIVDTSDDLTVACVSTGSGNTARAGWWRPSDPKKVVLCEVISGVAIGSFVKANACSSADGGTIVGSANGGNVDVPQQAVFCRPGATTVLRIDDQFVFEGEAQQVSANGTRIWGWQRGDDVQVPILWRDDNTVAFQPGDFQSFVNNFLDISRCEILDCSDDGRFCCGWYDLGNENVRRPFVIDSQDPTTPFEDCFTGLNHQFEGEARCMSADGSRVFVKRLDDGKTYQTNCTNPSEAIKPIADGDPLFCSESGDLVVGVDFNRATRSSVGWTVRPGSKRIDLKATGDYSSVTPTCVGLSARSIGAILRGKEPDAGLFRVGRHDGLSALKAARDSLDTRFAKLDFDQTRAISDDGRTFYVQGPSGDSDLDLCYYVELNRTAQPVWREKSRAYPAYITQYAYYAYYYALLAATEGDDAYDDYASVYGEVAYNMDATIRRVRYDYWQADRMRKRYAALRTQQANYEYYCYLFSQYGVAPQYGPYAEAYAMYAYQFMYYDL